MISKTKRLEYEVTHKCNLSCEHCYIPSMRANFSGKELDTGEAYSLIDNIVELKIPTLHFTGGEPLLRKDMLDLLSYSDGRMRTVLETNATLVDRDLAKKIKKSKIDSVTVSFDDLKGVMRGQTDDIKRGIRNLVQEEQKVMIHTDICNMNKDQISDIMDTSNSLGAKYFLIRLVLPVEGNDLVLRPSEVLDAYEKVQEKKKEYKNMTVIDDLLINEKIEAIPTLDPYGNLRPYAYTTQIVGNIREQSLESLLEKAHETPIEGADRIRKYLNEVQKFIQEH